VNPAANAATPEARMRPRGPTHTAPGLPTWTAKIRADGLVNPFLPRASP